MSDENVKKLLKAMDDKFKLLHGELARFSRELSRISKDTARIDSTLDSIQQTLNEHGDKLDAIVSDVVDLQNRADTVWKKISIDFKKTKDEVREIKGHLGLPV